MYDRALAKSKDILLTPSRAKKLLVASSSSSSSSLASSRSTKEFVREMLMFPLSCKNPEVPLVGGRRSRVRPSALPKKDKNRAEIGPERYIRWDMMPLPLVQENLEALKQQQQQRSGGALSVEGVKRLLEKGVNTVPYLGDGYYPEPLVDYDDSYLPQGARR